MTQAAMQGNPLLADLKSDVIAPDSILFRLLLLSARDRQLIAHSSFADKVCRFEQNKFTLKEILRRMINNDGIDAFWSWIFAAAPIGRPTARARLLGSRRCVERLGRALRQ